MENETQAEAMVPVPAETNTRASIMADSQGVLRPQSIEEAFRLATAFYRSKLLPARFNSPEMVLTAMQFVLELGLKPLTAMRQLAVIQGTPSLFGDLPLSLCYASGKLEAFREWYFDKDGKEICTRNNNLHAEPFGAGCWVKRKGDPEALESFFTMNDAERAGLFKNPVWKSYTKRMLRYRARSQSLKDKLPDVLNGISIAEYDFHTIPDDDGPAVEAPSRDIPSLKKRVEIMTQTAPVTEPPTGVSPGPEIMQGEFDMAEAPKLKGE